MQTLYINYQSNQSEHPSNYLETTQSPLATFRIYQISYNYCNLCNMDTVL